MHDLRKKTIAIVIAIACVGMIAPTAPAGATTVEELQTQIAALLAQIATLQSQLTAMGGTTVATTAACTGITFSRNLKQGMSGTDVKCLQSILNQNAATQVAASGVGSTGNETLYFGSLTYGAVVKFQELYASEVLAPIGLTAGTGFVGAKTIAKLNTMLTTGTAGTGGETTTPTLPTAAGLTVALAADNPAAGSIIADTGNAAGSQALIPFLKVNFSTPAGTSAKVTTLQVNRVGISSDTDISNAYLYDGSTKLAEMTSFSSGVMTFTNSAGLFTVSGTKTITVKGDLYKDSTAGKTLGFAINAATNITTDASAVNGTFPMNGNLMTVAAVADFGRLTVATTSSVGTVDPGITAALMNFTLQSVNQKVVVYSIKFQQIGSIANATDLTNLTLWAGATQLGSTVANLNTDGSVVFDLSSAPYEIPSGMTRSLSLKADVIGGSTRTIQFSIQKSTDIVVMDGAYNVYLSPDTTGVAVWTVQDGVTCTVNAGSVVVTKRTDSPSGNVALNGTNVTIASYDVKALGESIKVNNVTFDVASSSAWGYIQNVKLFYDGQVRGVTTQYQDATVTTMATNFTLPVGQTKTMEIRADIIGGGSAAFATGDTLNGTLYVGAGNAQRVTSLGTVNFPAATTYGNSLTVTGGALAGTKNSSVGEITTVNNVVQARIGSFYLTAGSAEGVDVTKISFLSSTSTATGTAASYSLGSAFNNLTLWYGSTQLGSTVVTNPGDAAATEYVFYPTNFSLVAGQTVAIDLKADVSSLNWSNTDCVSVATAEGTGKVTSTFIYSDGIIGHGITLTDAGVLTLALDSSRPNTAIVSMSQKDVTLGIWKLSASAVEDLTAQTIVAISSGTATSSNSVQNVRMYCGSDQYGVASTGLVYNALTGYYYAGFGGTCVIPKGSYKLVTVKGDITPYASGPYGPGTYSTNALDFISMSLAVNTPITGVETDTLIVRGAGDYASTTAVTTSTANNAYVYRTNLSASLVAQGTRARAATEKIASLTLTGTASADIQFRAAITEDDESSLDYWAASNAGSGLATSTVAKVDGSTSILWTVVAVAATPTWAVVDMDEALGDTTLLDYSKASIWIFPDASTTASGDFYWFFTDSTSTETSANSAELNAIASSTIATSSLTAATWNYVEVDIPTGIGTTTCVGIGIDTAGSETGMLVYLDNLKVYNDSITIDITGNASANASGTPVYLKSGTTEYAIGGYDPINSKVVLVPTTEISVGSTGKTFDLITDTTQLVDTDDTTTKTVNLEIDAGDADTAGDFRWYDQAVNSTTSITWVNPFANYSIPLSY